MTAETLLAFALYAFVTFITPGPNNIMLLASGVHFGFKRTLPHICGIVGGGMLMLILIGVGFGAIFTACPMLYPLIQYAGVAYLLYLAWKIASSGTMLPLHNDGTARTPMRFLGAAAFQWLNPKAWMMAVNTVSIYVPHQHYFTNVVLVTVFSALIGIPCVILWTTCGIALKRFLNHTRAVKAFNITMALLLVTSIYPVIKKMI